MPEKAADYNLLKQQGKRYLRLKEYNKAKDSFLSALIISPNDFSIRKLLIATYFLLKDDENVLYHLSFSLKPGYTPLFLTLTDLPHDTVPREVYLETYRYTIFNRSQWFFENISIRRLENHPYVCLRDDRRVLLLMPNVKERIEKPCVLLGGDTNYFQWTVGILPRLQGYFGVEKLRKLPLVVNSDLQPFQVESLKLLGISTDHLIKVDPNSIYSFSWLCVTPTPTVENAKYLRDRMMSKEVVGKQNQRLFLYRGKSHRRNLLNEDEVFDSLKPLGFIKIEPGKLTVKEQIKQFMNAEIIVGTHDAGFANLLFAREGTKVLELTHESNLMPNFAFLSKTFGLSHKRCQGKVDDSVDYRSGFQWQMANFTVDVGEVTELVRSMLH